MPSILRVVLAFLVLSGAAAGAQEPDIQAVMQRKLDQALAILEALIFEDFDGLEDSAEELEKLSRRSTWFIVDSPAYEERTAAFQLAVGGIAASARERSLEGAALGFMEMSLQCVQCHQLLRGVARPRAAADRRAGSGVLHGERGKSRAGTLAN